jgi:hypothetical protein
MRKPLHLAKRASLAALALGIGGALATATAASAAVVAHPGTASFSVQGTNLASDTLENLNLPTGATCSLAGNAGGAYISFLVPAGTDLTTLTKAHSPLPDQGTALYDTGGNALPQTNASNTPAGQITPSYAFQLDLGQLTDSNGAGYTVTGTQIPAGTAIIPTGQSSADYLAGVACFGPSGETDYYSTTITLTVAPNDPHGFTITTPTPSGGPILPEAPLAVGLPLGGAAVLLGAAYINRRRRSQPAATAGQA